MKSSYRDLLVWQKAMDLVDEVYRATRRFPKEEMYGLTAQMRRSSASIAYNIAEGQGRYTYREFRHFLRASRGSALEFETQVEIARRQGFLREDSVASLNDRASEVTRLLNGLIRYLDRKLLLRTANRELRT
ncbi:MAG TPA: four helix bundle protein [Thermoanaerobaculia bacterium]|nr:four helix bundle protein [Thermoanaerobaculia bacterium]